MSRQFYYLSIAAAFDVDHVQSLCPVDAKIMLIPREQHRPVVPQHHIFYHVTFAFEGVLKVYLMVASGFYCRVRCIALRDMGETSRVEFLSIILVLVNTRSAKPLTLRICYRQF